MVGGKRFLYRCIYLYIIYRHTYIHIYLGGGWEVNAAPRPRSALCTRKGLKPPLPGLNTANPGPTHHLYLTCRRLITACAAPVLLPAPYQCHEGGGASWPPAHIPSRCLTAATTALGQQWSQRWPSSYGLLLPWGLASSCPGAWPPFWPVIVIHRGSGMESPEPVLGQRWESCVNFLK